MPPHRVSIVYDVPGWAYHHHAVAMEKFAPPGFELTLRLSRGTSVEAVLSDERPDLIFCLPATKAIEIKVYLRQRHWQTKLVGYWSLGWPSRPDLFAELRDQVDLLVCSNTDYLRRVGSHHRVVQISNGVDLTVFRTIVPIEKREDKVIWIGSVFHRTVKGYDEFVVPLFRELERRGICCQTMLVDSFSADKLGPDGMAAWYNDATVLVCASESEGTPQPVLEAAACGCAIVSTAVGIVPELIRSGRNGYIVERRVDRLLEGVERAIRERHHLVRQMAVDIQAWHWQQRVGRYFDAFGRLLGADRPRVD